MNTRKYFTILALTGVLCAPQARSATVIPPRFNSSIQDAFYRAALENKPQKIQQLLNLGYSIDITDERGLSALCRAKSKGDDDAYNLLYKYGADDKAPCMETAEKIYRTDLKNKYLKYGGLTLLGASVAGLFAFSDGGSGGSSSETGSGDDSGSGSNVDYTPGNNGSTDSSRDWNTKLEPVTNTYGEIVKQLDDSYFENNKEYSDDNIQFVGSSTVNYLGAINAAEAYKHFYGTDSNGNFAAKLKNVNVGVIDSGVWGNHSEFAVGEGSKVSGYNFDYGPCLAGDTTNCWTYDASEKVQCSDDSCSLKVQLSDANGKSKISRYMGCKSGDTAEICYNRWAASYAQNYDWDKLQYYFYPNLTNVKLGNLGGVLHGSNVAGIIGANIDGKGNMGVAGANTTITAVRWDLMSSLADPLNKLLADGVSVVNMSFGLDTTDDINASKINDNINLIDTDELKAYDNIIAHYEDKTNSVTGITYKDGMVLIKAAGNSAKTQPNLRAGLKLLEKRYSDLQMLVVVAADVTMNGNKLESYKLSEFSNQCGVTKGYCITAPGGDGNDKVTKAVINSVGQPGSTYEYVGLAGTSQAAPVVSGSYAFLKGAYPYMSSQEIISLMLETANKNNASDGYTAEKYGAGLLDLGAAVNTYISNNGITTAAGSSLSDGMLNLSQTHLNVPSTFKNAMQKALPKTVTAFDKYARPFAMSTANYISVTHGGYKNLKNDVYQIAKSAKTTNVQQGGLSFTYSGSAGSIKGNGLGFMQADYQNGNSKSGFYFSENTKYENGGSFAAATKNPFMAFQNAYGVYNTFAFSKNAGLKFEAVTGRNGLYDGDSSYQDSSFKKQAYALNSELQLHKGEKFGFSLMNGLLYEEAAALGLNGNGAFNTQDSSTYNTGVKASWFVSPRLTLSGSYYRGYTQGQSFASNLLETSALTSESFAFDANYKVSKQTEFGFGVSSPLRVVDGTLSVNFPQGRDNYSDEVYFNRYKAALKPEAREYKLTMYASHDFNESLSVRSEFDVRINPEHQKQANDYRALMGLNWNFN